MGKKGNLSDFGCDMVVGLSISEAANILGYPHKTIAQVYREWSK